MLQLNYSKLIKFHTVAVEYGIVSNDYVMLYAYFLFSACYTMFIVVPEPALQLDIWRYSPHTTRQDYS